MFGKNQTIPPKIISRHLCFFSVGEDEEKTSHTVVLFNCSYMYSINEILHSNRCAEIIPVLCR